MRLRTQVKEFLFFFFFFFLQLVILHMPVHIFAFMASGTGSTADQVVGLSGPLYCASVAVFADSL
jgi:hypothetical protein